MRITRGRKTRLQKGSQSFVPSISRDLPQRDCSVFAPVYLPWAPRLLSSPPTRGISYPRGPRQMLSFICSPCQKVGVADLNSLCVWLVQLVLHVPHKLCRRSGPQPAHTSLKQLLGLFLCRNTSCNTWCLAIVNRGFIGWLMDTSPLILKSVTSGRPRWLRSLAAPAEDLGLISGTHMVVHNRNSSSRRPDAPFWPGGAHGDK